MNRLSFFALLAFLLASLSGCGGSVPGDTSGGGNTTTRMQLLQSPTCFEWVPDTSCSNCGNKFEPNDCALTIINRSSEADLIAGKFELIKQSLDCVTNKVTDEQVSHDYRDLQRRTNLLVPMSGQAKIRTFLTFVDKEGYEWLWHSEGQDFCRNTKPEEAVPLKLYNGTF